MSILLAILQIKFSLEHKKDTKGKTRKLSRKTQFYIYFSWHYNFVDISDNVIFTLN